MKSIVFAGAAALAQAQFWSWCQDNRTSWDICNPAVPIDQRAADIVSRLSIADKIQALVTGTPKLPSVNLPPYNWWSEATHGISHVQYSTELPYASNTALPITTSCSFNRSLWYATGNQIGREARAFQNNGQAYSTYWAPVINIVRDPRWGRNLETPGEDPFTVGEYARNFVKGFQSAPEDPYTLQASACCKHFVANELDGWNGTDRNHFDAYVPAQDLADSYLPPFQTCVQEGGVSGIMCSYNAVNGVPSCANDWLLGTVLRQAWEFDGYVTSDCDADSDVFFSHHYTNTPGEAVADILAAGTDVDCGGFMSKYAPGALSNGTITEADIDVVLTRLFRVRIRLGNFNPPGPLSIIGPADVCNPYALELARDGVRQSAVLLRNNASVNGLKLPLDPSAHTKIAIIGPNWNISDTFGYYAGTACNNSRALLADGITQFTGAAAVTNLGGVPSVSSPDTNGVPAAAALAAASDLVILAIGSDLSLEREGSDRTSIDFSDGQKALIAAVAAAANAPVVAVVFSGGAMDFTSLLSNPNISAILHVGQPSVQVVGVADVIFGRTTDGRSVVPAGRMSQMSYPAAFTSAVSMFDFGMRPGVSPWPPGTNPGRTYRFYTGTPVVPFGFGLSYTSFTYTPVGAPAAPVSLAALDAELAAGGAPMGHLTPALKATAAAFYVNVTNTGAVDADDVVLGFVAPPGAGSNGVPLAELFGFDRVFVPAGATVTVYLGAQARFFAHVRADGARRVTPGEYTVSFGVRDTLALGGGFATAAVTVTA